MRAFKIYDFTLSAGGALPLLVEGGLFKIYSSTGVVAVTIDGGSTIGPINAGQGMKTEFSRLTISDMSGAVNVGRIIVASNDFVDDRITGNVEVIDGGKNRSKLSQSFVGGRYVGPVAAQYGHLQLWNPGGTGKNLVLAQINYSTLATAGVWMGFYNAALATDLSVYIANKLVAAAVGVGQFRSTNNAALLFTTGFNYIHLTSSSPQLLRFSDPMVIPPGQGVVLALALLNTEFAAQFEWYEEAA